MRIYMMRDVGVSRHCASGYLQNLCDVGVSGHRTYAYSHDVSTESMRICVISASLVAECIRIYVMSAPLGTESMRIYVTSAFLGIGWYPTVVGSPLTFGWLVVVGRTP